MRFDGRIFAGKIEFELKEKVALLGSRPRLVIFLVGEDEGSVKYVELKKQLGKRIGVEVEVRQGRFSLKQLMKEVKRAVGDGKTDGLMVQLPIGDLSKEETEKILRLIPLGKDVDGLNPENIELIESGEQSFLPAVVRSVERILDEGFSETGMEIDEKLKIGVVGAAGNVGRPLIMRLRRFGMEVVELEQGDDLFMLKSCDVVISCTGRAGIVKKEMIKKGAICIDIGFPKGDCEDKVTEVASFFTPVPGGVGPVTVVSLMENVVDGVVSEKTGW